MTERSTTLSGVNDWPLEAVESLRIADIVSLSTDRARAADTTFPFWSYSTIAASIAELASSVSPAIEATSARIHQCVAMEVDGVGVLG